MSLLDFFRRRPDPPRVPRVDPDAEPYGVTTLAFDPYTASVLFMLGHRIIGRMPAWEFKAMFGRQELAAVIHGWDRRTVRHWA